jgi:transcriptional regulator with XRE-family HTH domain
MAINAAKLGKRVRAYRDALGYTISDLARESGVSRSYLYQVEEGTSSLTHEKLSSLAEALHVTIAELLGSDADMPEAPVVPPKLEEFAQQAKIPSADVIMLANIHYRGKQPTTVEGWRALYAIIKATTGGEL